MNLDNIVVVLCRPGEPGNVGAVCRAMKNMGLSRLRLVSPDLDNSPDLKLSGAGLNRGGIEAIIRTRAVHAAELWDNAKFYGSLAEAVSDCSVVVGTTRRRGRRRKQATMTPAETAAFLKERPGQAALVFGNERTGLEEDELKLCAFASHIPAAGAFPSLNLSHAVMIYAYELFRIMGGAIMDNAMGEDAGAAFTGAESAGENAAAVKGRWVPLDQTGLEKLVLEVTGSLKTLGFYKLRGLEEQEIFFRDIFSRAAVTEKEARYFSHIIAKAARLAGVP